MDDALLVEWKKQRDSCRQAMFPIVSSVFLASRPLADKTWLELRASNVLLHDPRDKLATGNIYDWDVGLFLVGLR